MNNVLVSVIIPVFNGEKFICTCLNSLINQTYNNIEIIVINDGSIDNTLTEIAKVKDDRIKVISIANGGVSNARNIGLANATGDYIMFADADDYLELTAISKLVNIVNEKNVDIIRFNGYAQNEKHEFNSIPFECQDNLILDSNDYDNIIKFFNNKQEPRCYTPLLFIKNNNIKLFNTDLKYLEDKLFYLENLTVPDKKILFTNIKLYYYTFNFNSKTKSCSDIVSSLRDLLKASEYISEFVKSLNCDSVCVYESVGYLLFWRLHYYAKHVTYRDFKKLCLFVLQNHNYKLKKKFGFVVNLQILLLNCRLYLILYLIYKIK